MIEPIEAEAILLGWSTNDKGHTARIQIHVHGSDALVHPFHGMHVGAEHGQRFVVTFQPVEE